MHETQNIERRVPQRGINPLVGLRRELDLTRKELALMAAPYLPRSVDINQVLQSILLVETGAKVPPHVPMWGAHIGPVLANIGVDVPELEMAIEAWVRQGAEPDNQNGR
jgi:hypothetical protein